jgi:hypothetical protein
VLGKYWEHFSHDADIGIRGIGATKEKAFEQAAIALTSVITDPHHGRDTWQAKGSSSEATSMRGVAEEAAGRLQRSRSSS